MKKSFILSIAVAVILAACVLYAGSKSVGQRCIGDAECEFGSECKNGVCTKKKEYDYGSSGKTGQPCMIDADCIGSGRCVEGNYGQKHCSGK